MTAFCVVDSKSNTRVDFPYLCKGDNLPMQFVL